MIGSIYAGLSGLTAHSIGLRTISGNVANLNAQGFKGTEFRFDSIEALGDRLAGRDTYGVRIGESRIDFSQGDLRASGGDFDLAIDGKGLFVLIDGGERVYARTGSFVLDDDGFIVDGASGYRLGTLADGGGVVPVNLADRGSKPAQPSTRIAFAGNLSSTGDTASVANAALVGPNGEPLVWDIAFARAEPASQNRWTVTVTDDDGTAIGSGEIRFIGGTIDPAASVISVTDAETGLTVDLDFSEGVTSFSSGTISTIRSSDIDGAPEGSLVSIFVDEQGAINLSYSNGETDTLARVAMASFDDPQRLTQIGDGLFAAPDDAKARIASSAKDGLGRLISGQIEASNIDLSQEFGKLILVQRGFQASSQVISVSNEMIEQLFNLRG